MVMYAIRIFEELCVGCRSCMVACQAVRGLAADTTPLVITIKEELTRAGELRLRFAAEACRHCADAPCAAACPVNAIEYTNNRQVMVNEEQCASCGLCEERCPYGAIKLDADREVAVKCDLCAARAESGLKPACVAACPGKAIYSGKREQIEEQIIHRREAMRQAREQKP
jgi:Fe-S-cluster-containing dehydrogenase component